MVKRKTPEEFEAAFWSRVVVTDRCWLWSGVITDKGYGTYCNRIWGTYRAHRIAWMLIRGPLASDITLDHVADRCGNKSCVNPDHLEPVSQAVNHRRWVDQITHCKHGHEFTPENTQRDNRGGRVCRECSIASGRRKRAQRKQLPVPSHAVHGKVSTYSYFRCRCPECRAAWSIYERERRDRKAKSAV